MGIQCCAQIIRNVEGHKLNASTFYGHFTFEMSMKYAECTVSHRDSNEPKFQRTPSNFVSKMEFVCLNSLHKLILYAGSHILYRLSLLLYLENGYCNGRKFIKSTSVYLSYVVRRWSTLKIPWDALYSFYGMYIVQCTCIYVTYDMHYSCTASILHSNVLQNGI